MPRTNPAWLALRCHSDVRTGIRAEKVSPVWWLRNCPRQSAANPAFQGALDIGAGGGEPGGQAGVTQGRAVTVEMCSGVFGEIPTVRGDLLGDDVPHGLAEFGGSPEQLEPRQRSAFHLAEVRPQQRRLPRLPRAMVNPQVRQVEVQIAHPGVLPIDD